MNETSSTERYIEHINSHILPFIDYGELQASYETDMVYAKGVLNRLHTAMVEIYGGERLDEMDGDEGFVVIPGVLRGIDSGKLCLALLELDLSSSGEHWGTSYLCKYGLISQDGIEKVSNNKSVLKSEIREINSTYLPYDYCYTASIPGDIHVEKSWLPEAIKNVLNDFRIHNADLLSEDENIQNTPKTKYFMDEREFENKMIALLPGANLESVKALISYAKELKEDDSNNSPSELYKEVYVELNLITRRYGQEISQKVLDMCVIEVLNSFEMSGAANFLRDGVTPEKVGQMASADQCYRTDKEWQEFKTAMEAFENGTFDKSADSEKKSVLNRIREAEKAPKNSRKDKSIKNKKEAEH